jgi:hypothetical protein
VCWWLLRPSPDTAVISVRQNLYETEKDAELGYVLKRNHVQHAVKALSNGVTCYDATYRTDDFRRRIVRSAPEPPASPLMLFGCSFTFGEGLNDPDTLAASLAKALPGTSIYNYAAPGYGPSQALALVTSNRLPKEIPSAGPAVYVFTSFHVSRVIGDTRAFWLYDGPYYELGSDGHVTRLGSFKTGRAWKTWWYDRYLDFKALSNVLEYLNLDFPVHLGRRDIVLTAAVLDDAARAYKKLFNKELVVAFHPKWEMQVEDNRMVYDVMKEELARRNVRVFDYTDMPYTRDDQLAPGCDEHPNGAFNARFAQRLAADVSASGLLP